MGHLRATLKAATLLLLTGMFIAGCGQKGPLFLPGDPSTVQTDIPQQNAPEDIGEDAEDDEEDH